MHKKWWRLSVLAVILAGAGLWHMAHHAHGGTDGDAPGRLDGVANWFSRSAVPQAEQTSGKMPAIAGDQTAGQHASPLDSMILPTFRATTKGTLAMDQQTRLDVERIYALFPRDEALAKLASQSGELPTQAQRELKDLFQKYTQYAQALTQSFPPGENTGAIDEASRQFEGIKSLRRQYFGEDLAQSLFGDEEKTSQELLELMRKQNDPKLSLEQKAEQAQEEWKRRQQAGSP